MNKKLEQLTRMNKRLEQAELLILTESPEFKSVIKDLAQIIAQYRSDEHSCAYLSHYVIDVYDDGSGAIYNGKNYLEEPLVEFPE